MRNLLKKLLSVGIALAVIALSLFSGQPLNAKASEKNSDCPSCVDLDTAIEELAQDGTTTSLEVSGKTKAVIDKVVASKDKEYSLDLKQLKKEGFKSETKANNYITFDNLKDEDLLYEKVGVFTGFFLKKGNEEIARQQVWVDLKTNEVVRYDIIKMDAEGNGTQLVAFDKKDAASTDSGEIGTYKFKFNGISFACSMAGLIACTAAFGGLAVFVPVAGGLASLGCAIAFNIGCSYT